jgi:hypothetical protein
MRLGFTILVASGLVLSGCSGVTYKDRRSSRNDAIIRPADMDKARSKAASKCGLAGVRQLPGTRGTNVSDYDCGSR